jgi:hypothetical protein
MYFCPRCGYSTVRKSNYKKHLHRKTICKAIIADVPIDTMLKVAEKSKMNPNESKIGKSSKKMNPNESKKLPNNIYMCNYCQKPYSTNSNLNKHYKRCKLKIELQLKETEWKKEKEEWNEERKELYEHITKLIDKAGPTTINNIHNQNNNNIQNTQNNINLSVQTSDNNSIIKKIRDFGDENMEHITHDFCKELLKEPYSGPNKLVRAIHFDPNYRENYNVQATNRKSNITSVVRNGKWEYMNKKTLLNREYIKTNQILDDCFDREKENMDKEFRELYERFKLNRNELHQYNNTLCNIFIEILNGTNKIKLLDLDENTNLLKT